MKQAGEIYVYNITVGTWFPIAVQLAGTFTTLASGSTQIIGNGSTLKTVSGVAMNNYWLINKATNEAQLIIDCPDDNTINLKQAFSTDLNGATCLIVEHHKLRSLRAIFKTGDGTVRSAHQDINSNATCSFLQAFESGDVEAGMTPLFIVPGNSDSVNVRIII